MRCSLNKPFDPNEPSLGFLLYDAARLMRRDFDRRAKVLGLTRAQWSVLAHLRRNEGSNQASIADHLDVEPITLVRLLDRLEEAGWIERRVDAKDRRARLIYLTEKTHPILAKMQELGGETRDLMMAGIPEPEQARMYEHLLRMRANLTSSAKPADATETYREAENA